MKIAILLALLVVICVAYTQAQRRCIPPREPTCEGGRREGVGEGPRCRRNAGTRWYWNPRRRECMRMYYRGCDGNGNRWCSKRECDRMCPDDTRPRD